MDLVLVVEVGVMNLVGGRGVFCSRVIGVGIVGVCSRECVLMVRREVELDVIGFRC
jgi:ribose/xylose/arabinose/galactoside ABC-type transport system permease subunit